jgi:hypothetical protein
MDKDEVETIARQCASLADGSHTIFGSDRKVEIFIVSLEDDGLTESTLVQSLWVN